MSYTKVDEGLYFKDCPVCFKAPCQCKFRGDWWENFLDAPKRINCPDHSKVTLDQQEADEMEFCSKCKEYVK